jgi:hypothetical protein
MDLDDELYEIWRMIVAYKRIQKIKRIFKDE